MDRNEVQRRQRKLQLIKTNGQEKIRPSFLSVSIIVPAKNNEITVKDCIESLLNLDYPKEDLEIILVDGFSTDKTRLARGLN